MSGAASTLAEHHRHCEALFVQVADDASTGDWQRITARVAALREALLAHFRYEEERIFPLYEQASGQEGATESLCAQHDDMRAALWALATLSTADDLHLFRTEFADLRAEFDAHAADEEQRMYPVFERMLAAGLLRP